MFFVVVGILTAMLIFGAKGILGLISSGQFELASYLILGFLALLYLAPLGSLYITRIRRGPAEAAEAPLPPSGIPQRAIFAVARLPRMWRSPGWLWIEGEFLVFRGVGFDFRLRASDFKTRRGLTPHQWGKRVRSQDGIRLVQPEGISARALAIFPTKVSRDMISPDPSAWARLEADLEAWSIAAKGKEPSILPPIRPRPGSDTPIAPLEYIVPPLLMVSIVYAITMAIPFHTKSGELRAPLEVFGNLSIPSALLGLMWPLFRWVASLAEKGYEKEVEKAKRLHTQARTKDS